MAGAGAQFAGDRQHRVQNLHTVWAVFRLEDLAARKTNLAVAVLLVSLAFCSLHFSPHQPPLVMLSTFLFSLFKCAWTLRTGSIWGVMGWHAGWNWLLATGFELPVIGT
ncbi:hypothetical protein A7X76_14625 [Stenotrophomonas maltophilia]|uniref:CPBP family intramembrane glutamic endopeptidase n=1 Tax=Stenotrophomonas maltophilia TaxID=40324 RepID=UPI000DB530C5|nr:CPBP family intramembrane glutamic endopeptidase [Stenotrophomonas maltophilia]PZS67638.1 hypothetical protein A7X76_14625 [Stenotrophomonas maltophilia]